MRLSSDLVPAVIRRRLNRFAVLVELAGREEAVHLPNSGRLRELLISGTRAYLVPRPNPRRKTSHDLLLVDVGTLVCADARLPTPLLAEALRERRVSGFEGYTDLRPEVRCGESRIDLALTGPAGLCLVETKSVTLVEGDCALFPDAPTERGVRHLRTLIAARAAGAAAAVVFVVQRADAGRFAPHPTADPRFRAMLGEARAGGVAVRAFRCAVTLDEVRLEREIEMVLP